MRLLLSGALLLIVGSPGGWFQSRRDLPPSFRVDAYSSLYEVRAFDTRGRFVQGLTAADFQVVDSGNPRPIAYFEERHAGLSLGCLIKITNGMDQPELSASKELLGELIHLLAPDDEIALAVYDREVSILQSLTADRSRLQEAIDNISPGWRASFWARFSSAFSTPDFLGAAVDHTLLDMRGPLREIKAVLVLLDRYEPLHTATGDHLESADARFFVVSLKQKEPFVFDVRRRAAPKEDPPRWGGVGFNGVDLAERVADIRDALTRHYLIALEGEPPATSAGEPSFSVPSHPDATVLAVRRLEPGPSVYRP